VSRSRSARSARHNHIVPSQNVPVLQTNPAAAANAPAPASSIPHAVKPAVGAGNHVRLTGSLGNVFLVAAIGYMRRHPWTRAFAACIGVLFFAGWFAGLPWFRSNYSLAGAALLVFAAAVGSSKEVDLYIGEPEEVVERREVEERLKIQGTANPYEFLDLDSKRLSEYYVINQNQARSGFRWAIAVMLLGFGTVIGGVWIFYLRTESQDRTLTGLSVVAGLLTDLIAATFLYLNNNTQKLALYYYGRLASLQNLALSIRLADAHEDAAAKAAARNRIIDRLLELASAGDVASARPEPLQQGRGTNQSGSAGHVASTA
jgi:hypothetical protein